MDNRQELLDLLHQVAQGEVTPEKALLEFKTQPFEDLGYAKVDLHRGVRQGAAEVIYGAGKTPEQISKIIGALMGSSFSRVRASSAVRRPPSTSFNMSSTAFFFT